MRILAVGNMYPPHHLGGHELAWRSAMRHLRANGHTARVLTTDFRTGTAGADEPDTFRDLRWYWRDHRWPRIGWRGRIALERHNAAALERHLRELEPDVVSWWSVGGMSLSMIERVRRWGLPAVAFVADDWLLYGPRVDRWTGAFRGLRVPGLGFPGLGGALAARLAERVTGLPARVDLDRGVRYVLMSETVRDRARSTGLSLRDSEIAHLGVDPDAEQRRWHVVSLLVARIARINEIADRERQNRTRHTPCDEGGAIVSPCATLSDHPRKEGGGW